MFESTWRWECGKCGVSNNAAYAVCPVPAPMGKPETRCGHPRPAGPVVSVPVLSGEDFERFSGAVDKLDASRDRLAQAQQVVVSEMGNLRDALKAARVAAARGPAEEDDRAPSPHRLQTLRRENVHVGPVGDHLKPYTSPFAHTPGIKPPVEMVLGCMAAAASHVAFKFSDDELRAMGVDEWTECVHRVAVMMAQHLVVLAAKP